MRAWTKGLLVALVVGSVLLPPAMGRAWADHDDDDDCRVCAAPVDVEALLVRIHADIWASNEALVLRCLAAGADGGVVCRPKRCHVRHGIQTCRGCTRVRRVP